MKENSTTSIVTENSNKKPIVLSHMGSFMFGGAVETNSNGGTIHGDHGYAQFFIPTNARSYPLVMWHGLGQCGKCWESTPDGRDGFMQIFTRCDWPVYIIDQPRRGRAGRALSKGKEPSTIPTTSDESSAWKTFRIGSWTPPGKRNFEPNVAFPRDEWSINQFFRQQTPNTGDEPFPDKAHRNFLGETVAKLFDHIGPGILLTHSHSGQYGWETAMMRPDLVKAVIAYEPGEFAFPDDELPPEIVTSVTVLNEFMAPQPVSREKFLKLTKIPIAVVLGDFITTEPSTEFEPELWRIVSIRAKQFIDTINRNGGNAVLQDLPSMGIFGNTHSPFSDTNNVVIADLLSTFLAENKLDDNDDPHRGPKRET